MNSDYKKENYLRLSGVTILYNPAPDVLDNLRTYIDNLDKLYIIDNSDVKDHILLTKIRNLSEKCEVILNAENYGIATALNQAIKLALHDGFEWLLTMDQDSYFEDNIYFKAFHEYKNKNEVGLFTPEINEPIYKIRMSSAVTYLPINDIAYTSASIMNLHISQKINYFNEKLFIDAVDTDYCLRLLKHKYPIIKILGSPLIHKVGEKRVIYFPFNKKLILTEHLAFRHYYITRNHTYILFKYFLFHPKFVFLNYYRVIYNLSFELFFNQNRLKILRYTLIGFFHCLTNRFGKLK